MKKISDNWEDSWPALSHYQWSLVKEWEEKQSAKWQVWTPEMQEAEFQKEYSGAAA
jgi:hypothetical protein